MITSNLRHCNTILIASLHKRYQYLMLRVLSSLMRSYVGVQVPALFLIRIFGYFPAQAGMDPLMAQSACISSSSPALAGIDLGGLLVYGR